MVVMVLVEEGGEEEEQDEVVVNFLFKKICLIRSRALHVYL